MKFQLGLFYSFLCLAYTLSSTNSALGKRKKLKVD